MYYVHTLEWDWVDQYNQARMQQKKLEHIWMHIQVIRQTVRL